MSNVTTPPSAPEQTPPGEEVPSRLKVLWRRRRNLLLALVLLIVAAAVAAGSLAVFSSESANPQNTFSSGSLSIDNNKEGAAIFTAANMLPGDTAQGTVTIRNSGDASGDFSVSDEGLTDTPGPAGGNLSTALDLTIVDLGPDGVPGGGDDVTPATYNGRFDALPTVDLGNWVTDEQHTYQFTVTFRDTGVPSGPTTGDNAFENASTQVTYAWDAVSD